MLCCLGSLGFDVTVSQRLVIHGQQTHGRILHQLGGSAAIAAYNAAAQGTKVCFAGLAGMDALANAAIAQLEQAGVETRVVRRGRSCSVLILVHEDGERTMITDPGDSLALGRSDIRPDLIHDARVAHFEGWPLFNDKAWMAWVSLARLAKDAGARVTLDACSATRIAEVGRTTFLARVSELAPEFLLCSASEAEVLELSTTVPAGVDCVVIHRGEKPTRIIDRRSTRRVPVSKVTTIVDTAGAGDSFAAGFCSALVDGASVDAAVDAGHRLASIAVSQNGCLIRMDALSAVLV
jgi:sugar/nucleoside kinase (ribokinase family)